MTATDGEMWRVLDRYVEQYGPIDVITQDIGAAGEARVLKMFRDALLRGSPVTRKELDALNASLKTTPGAAR